MERLLPYTPPPWASDLPSPPEARISLANLPTPLDAWAPPGFERPSQAWIKRDDATGATLSGNKVRKLEFLLAEAVKLGSDIVITCGGLQSNHARATAVAARQLGLDSQLFLRTTDTDGNPGLAGNLLLDRMVGASITLITPDEYRRRSEVMEAFAQEARRAGRSPYVIPEGGSNALGCWGYIEAVHELGEQFKRAGHACDDIVFACGSGGTAAGLALGVHLGGMKCKVHAVNVCDDASYFYACVNRIFGDLEADVRAEDLLDIMDGHVGRGYALSTTAELDGIKDVAQTTGVILDPVYSGKAYIGLTRERETNPDRFQGDRTLFIHTGGLFGLYDKLDMLSRIL